MGGGGLGASGLDDDLVLHRLPQLVGEHTGLLRVGEIGDQPLERPQCLLGATTKLAVDRPRLEAEIEQPLLHRLYLIAIHPLAERRRELRLHRGRIGGNDHRGQSDARNRQRRTIR